MNTFLLSPIFTICRYLHNDWDQNICLAFIDWGLVGGGIENGTKVIIVQDSDCQTDWSFTARGTVVLSSEQ